MKYKPINGWTKEGIKAELRRNMPARGSCDDDNGYCQYFRKSDGKRCAAGALMPLEFAKEADGTIFQALEEFPELLLLLPLEPAAMRELQLVHDSANNSRERCIAWVEMNVSDE